ncbi:TetR/AcrR family transcriptional regulator [Burkholderiaceae bacterium DAT-1]|nr:TetR/AcrR family transcriptional regulator [Burkholderiaceae bacterium DAT-1]
MSTTQPDARMRMVATAADMLRRRGMVATSIRDLAKLANAPLGSTYHYFPGGKAQLLAEAVEFASGKVFQVLRKAEGPIEGLQLFMGYWRDVLVKQDFTVSCPLVAVSAEEGAGEEHQPAREKAAEAFASWVRFVQHALMTKGVPSEEAFELGTLAVSAIEGGIVICRAQRSIEPLERIARQLERQFQAALERVDQ